MSELAANNDLSFPVTDLKQWVYCPRVFYFQHCLPNVRPETHLMSAGIVAGTQEEGREERRSVRPYGLVEVDDGQTQWLRAFNVPVSSTKIGLRGEVDMVIQRRAGDDLRELIPVDYKLSERAGKHFQLQLTAYAMLLEEAHGIDVPKGFLYLIELRRAEAVTFDPKLRKQVLAAVEGMRKAAHHEQIPQPTPQISKCIACEFRRFCNDVL